MPYYKCTFVNENGNFLKRIIFGDSKGELEKSYLNSDEKLINIKRIFFGNVSVFNIFSKKIKYSEFLLFNQKLITLLKSGISFIKALEIIIKNTGRGNLREILLKAESDIKNGVQISDALSHKQIPFYKIYRASLLAGERSGNLISILERFNIYLEKITNLRRRTISNLSYPVILFLFMMSMVFIIMVYVIPRFSSFYESFDAELPAITKFFINFGNFLQQNVFYIILIFLLIYVIIKLIENYNKHIIIIDYLKLKVPFIGKIIVENSLAVFSRTLAILIEGGITIPESTTVTIGIFSNKFISLKARNVPVKIKEGFLLSDVLEEIKIFPAMMIEVLRVGESSGNLSEVLNKNADFYENSIDTKISTFISLIEPFLIIILGLVIAFMLISIYLPIFSAVRVVR